MRQGTSISLKQIAESTNLSITTISRVLRDNGEVSSDTRKRVLDAAKKMRYRPNMLVQGIQTGKTRTMGVVVPPYDSYWTSVLCGIHDALTEADHVYINVWCPYTGSDHSYIDLLQEQLHRLIDRRVDGFILWAHLAPLYNENLIKDLEARDLPVVTIDHELSFADCVETDEWLGATLAAEHLLELGHKHIAHLGWDSFYKWAHLRRTFFEQAIEKSGKASCLTITCKEDEDVEGAAKTLLSANPRPTAIFACSDRVAKMIYAVAGQMGLKIPGDLSVIGFADLEFSQWMQPSLTTIRQNGREMGKVAAKTLVERSCSNNRDIPPRRIQIKCEIIKRASTAVAPKNN
ncbi:MAG: LacI family DNA-binding transcriptional regulator [Phycisphaerae bacterium]|nr:LacI family DNA-binding transcriptional regulator [Phycisphaerae bacterium]